MKTRCILAIFSFCVLSSANSQRVLSLNALFTEQDAVLISGLEGSWFVPDFNLKVSIKKGGDNFYFLQYGTDKNSSVFEAAIVKIDQELVLDLSGSFPDSIGDDEYRNSFITCHSFYKVHLNKDTLQLSEFNYAWFYENASNKNFPLKYEWVENGMLLTSKTEEVKSFLFEHINNKALTKEVTTLIYKHPDIEKESESIYRNTDYKSGYAIAPNCKPEFPFQYGWLGADGDVSVPINDHTILFLFSDTYVGKRNQQSRQEPGMVMVSNTVGVETCLPDGKTEVKYYWNNMYAENPQPLFKTFTSRYRFWVNDAFIVKNSLYVLLEKIGPKKGGSPDDLFNFSLLGFSLAKIDNYSETPEKWNIELISLPEFKNPYMGIRSHAIQDGYVYFFVSRNDNAQLLVRKNADFLGDPEKPFEYYALNKTWKSKIKVDDMDTLYNGFRGTTVQYHADLKQWIMLGDIHFMDNKIKMRTAPALTGPWSEEVAIYEIPEVTPGNTLYSKTNFTYLPRECFQNYDMNKKEMVITYDINSSDFSEIISNPAIYTPKVITVSLKGKLGQK